VAFFLLYGGWCQNQSIFAGFHPGVWFILPNRETWNVSAEEDSTKVRRIPYPDKAEDFIFKYYIVGGRSRDSGNGENKK
jgi:hypothetical protein